MVVTTMSRTDAARPTAATLYPCLIARDEAIVRYWRRSS